MKKIIIIVITLLMVFFVVPTITTIATHSYYFASRTEYQNEYYDYLTSQNEYFTREEHSFKSNNDQTLNGFIYSQSNNNEEPLALLIWVHGINVSHENYLSEINYLTKLNYIVFAYDNTGVNYSEGSGLKGLLQSPIDLQHALNYIYDLDLYNNLPNILIGHSWGGFSVASVSGLELKREVDGIISLGGFWKNVNVLIDTAQYYVGGIAKVLTPYLTMYENLLFLDYNYLNGIYGLNNTTCDVLIIHSKDDVIVHFDTNYTVYYEEFKEDSRFTFKEYEDFAHQLTIDKDSYIRIHDIMHHEQTDELTAERHELINNLNYTVIGDITTFISNIVNK